MTLNLIVNLNSSLSRPTKPTAAVATAIDCGEIILAMSPPSTLIATRNAGSIPICVAVTACKGAKREPLFTTDPVKNTPNQPNTGEKRGKRFPVLASAIPIVAEIPEYVQMNESANTLQIVKIGRHNSLIVSNAVSLYVLKLTLKIIIVINAAKAMAVVVFVNKSSLNIAAIVVCVSTTGADCTTELCSPGI